MPVLQTSSFSATARNLILLRWQPNQSCSGAATCDRKSIKKERSSDETLILANYISGHVSSS